jgi:hypothetical protein
MRVCGPAGLLRLMAHLAAVLVAVWLDGDSNLLLTVSSRKLYLSGPYDATVDLEWRVRVCVQLSEHDRTMLFTRLMVKIMLLQCLLTAPISGLLEVLMYGESYSAYLTHEAVKRSDSCRAKAGAYSHDICLCAWFSCE